MINAQRDSATVQLSSCKSVGRLTQDHDGAGEAVQQEGHFALCEGPEEDAAQPGSQGRDGKGGHQEQ